LVLSVYSPRAFARAECPRFEDAGNPIERRMRVLVHNMPRLLRDIVEGAIVGQPDMELVAGEVPMPAPRSDSPDVAVVGTRDPGNTAEPLALLMEWPRSRVLMVATSGLETVLYDLRAHRTALGPMSPLTLVQAIRRAAADERE
jgi:hypothetical protein